MHELFTQVLSKKDLSKAGDLFSVADQEIVNDLTEVINKISEITSLPDYLNNDNDQSVVEICITRVTSAIRETGSIEKHAAALVGLLESCLSHNLKPSPKDEDPPHAKISSDIISCLFLNYSKKEVMKCALPVAVKFLHKGNRELSRNMSSYLSLAAIENADLLSQHIQPIIDSIISGNYALARVLPQIYAVNSDALHEHTLELVSLLPICENAERLALLSLFALIAKNKPALLEPSVPQLCEHLCAGATAPAAMQVFLALASSRPHILVDHLAQIKGAADSHPNTLCLAAQVVSSVGKISKDRAEEALNFVLEHLPKADRGSQGTLLREATLLCTSYPSLFTERMLAEVRQANNNNSNSSGSTSDASSLAQRQHNHTPQPQTSGSNSQLVNQMPGGVTIVKVNGGSSGGGGSKQDLLQLPNPATPSSLLFHPVGGRRDAFPGTVSRLPLHLHPYHTHLHQHPHPHNHPHNGHPLLRPIAPPPPSAGAPTRPRSATRLGSAVHVNRSMTRLNIGMPVGSSVGLHKSMTRLSSSQQINLGGGSSGGGSSGGGLVSIHHHQIVGAGGSNRNSVAALGSRHNLVLQPSTIVGLPVNNHVSSGGVTVTTSPGTASPTKSMSGGGSLSGGAALLREEKELLVSFPPLPLHHTNPASRGDILPTLLPAAHSSIHRLHHSSSPSPYHPYSGGTSSPLSQSGNAISTTPSLPPPFSPSMISSSSSSSPPPVLPMPTLSSSQMAIAPPPPPPIVQHRRNHNNANNTSVTIISPGNGQQNMPASQRISVFEPFPMRDTVQHFCEKHLDKIKAYMDKVSVKIPPPAKCTIEERKAKKLAKLHFACQGRGEHCLYSRTFFTMKTRNPRVWIHLMFLALQARSQSALSSRDTSVSSLKNCWDILKCENKTFVTLVTSAFPCSKDQESLLNELRNSGFFDVFEYNGGAFRQWGCFLCNHPDRAVGFLTEGGAPVIEGQLQEKKRGRWRLFKRWRTRYFTLSGGHLTVKGTNDREEVATPIELHQIRSVKVSRTGGRNIPKAFEIFTGDRSLVLKPKDGHNAEEWVQWLSIAVAHSQARGGDGSTNASGVASGKSNSLPARGAGMRTAV
ncbi:protein melted [Hetaerina americana]|uniref:protein melted n=1 Tax=Hetaerina americana TaxID=62018 RepID=UPI003A7F3CA5